MMIPREQILMTLQAIADNDADEEVREHAKNAVAQLVDASDPAARAALADEYQRMMKSESAAERRRGIDLLVGMARS